MSKKKWLPVVIVLIVLSNWLIFRFMPPVQSSLSLRVTVKSDVSDEYQLFYSNDGIWSIDQSSTARYEAEDVNNPKELEFYIGKTGYSQFRFDMGAQAADITVLDAKFCVGSRELSVPLEVFADSSEQTDLGNVEAAGDGVNIEAEDGDPRMTLALESNIADELDTLITEGSKTLAMICKILVCAAIDILLIGFLIVSSHVKTLLMELYQNRRLIGKLAYNDFKTKYVGSYLGIIWAFVQPLITVCVYYCVFGIGLKSAPVNNVPFLLYLISGLVPWFFFSDALGGGTNAMIEYQYLVKKIVFKISMLPVVKLISALFVHVFFTLVALAIAILYGYTPGLHLVQIIYYIFCNFMLTLGLVYATCSIVIFFRDTTQIINIILQVGIWMTPIMWTLSIVPEKVQFLFKLIPMYYIVDGYRDAIYNGHWFWEKPYETILFWFITAAVFGIGTMVFKRLKVHFADVL